MNKAFKSLVVILALGGVMVSTSCKKNSVNGKVKQVVTTTNGQTTTTVNTYDSQGRLIAQSGGTTIAYSASTVTVSGTTGTPTVYTLNNQGYAGSDNDGVTYTYDNSGYLTGEVTTTGNSLTNTISNGDVVSTALHVGAQTQTTSYTYLTNVDYRDFGISFLGKNSTHVLNTKIVTSGGSTVTYTYSYNFDSDGRVLTENITGSNGSNTSSTYTY